MEALLWDIKQSRLEKEFEVFHRDNPKVWEMFERFALATVSRGKHHYGAKAIMERVRWEMDFQTFGDSFKINNNHIAFYARMFLRKHPSCAGFFATRKQTARTVDAPRMAQEV